LRMREMLTQIAAMCQRGFSRLTRPLSLLVRPICRLTHHRRHITIHNQTAPPAPLLEMAMPLPVTSPVSSSLLLTRRGLLHWGGIGVLGLGLPRLLQASAPVAGGRSGPERACIFIVQYGGASYIDSLDPRPDAPEAIRGPYKPIASRVPGVRLSELLP